jgi:mono/diheme cytochrome c family protein
MLWERAALCLAASVLLSCAACSRSGHGTDATASVTRGAALFAANCAVCHTPSAPGGRIGGTLAGVAKRKSRAAIAAVIEDPQPPMPRLYPGELSAKDVRDLTAYVESL